MLMVDMVNTRINGAWNILLPHHRAVRPEWDIANGGWEVERLRHMHDHIQPGQRVLYVGAEEGDMCGLLASWGAQLCMVEPNEAVWPNIKAIWDANNLAVPAWTYVGFCGAEDSVNSTDGYTHHGWPACADGPVIGDHGFKELRDPGTRPITTIDAVPVPDVIALDVEGSEALVLRGAEQTLREAHPTIYLSLHPEFLFDQYGTYSGDLRNWIRDLGYTETLLEYPLHECHLVYT
jgi:hypothetical protein